MSLDYDLSKIKNRDEVCFVERIVPASQGGDGIKTETVLSAVTETLIFATMFVGIREITENNVEKFFERLELNQAANGGLIREWPEDEPNPVNRNITQDELVAHIGLSTNASSISDVQYKKNLLELLKRNTKRFKK